MLWLWLWPDRAVLGEGAEWFAPNFEAERLSSAKDDGESGIMTVPYRYL